MVVAKKDMVIDPDQLLEHCRTNLAPFKVPKKVIVVEALPKTPTGKILKRQMRQDYKGAFNEE